MKKIRYGIIGFGSFAERAILPAIRASKNSEIAALQKRSLSEAKRKAEEFSVPLYFDTPEKLVQHAEIDAVFIASANSQHYSETLAAAEAGKHVLVEKPMAMNAVEAKGMIETCKTAKVKLMTGHMLRFSPLLLRMKELAAAGEIGDIISARAEFYYDARNSKRQWLRDMSVAGGGPLFDIGIHCLDSLRFVLDDTVKKVKSISRPKPTKQNIELSNMTLLEFRKGTIGTIYTSFETSLRQTFIELAGTNGSLSAYNFTPSKIKTSLQIKHGDGLHSFQEQFEEFEIPDLYELEITHFSDCILFGKEPMITGESSLHNQIILDEALKDSQR
ncbi:MAG: Gfo/Idh/MocA family oxidoreductase [Bacteroidetes bacterium]|nr:Gfo/Idh/MocA family oxidoreductase [Bacteroidota bacterium]